MKKKKKQVFDDIQEFLEALTVKERKLLYNIIKEIDEEG